ncbi:zinc finger AN1 and C2H2 domain-containing stress-associated protein 16 [Cocos nucifera]|uniref:Zinc finger AN1 and C2H2 domain-containing stress-associated protein 16 n=1 Tax=Cocos nucifera TaxID=13894 RepID=A0A8K0N3L6_COCNU|nr:zinc finger AN1 and C2H2 domain-containing stress-associated protein 16 [Cocos nucifera]
MGTPEFPDLGKHCNVEDCRQIDFLPFTCDRCNKVFCLEHRSYTKHLCPNANQQDVTVLVCPLCAKGVRLVPNEDPNITWESHVNSDCDPSNYQKATKKKRCPVPGCKELLTFSNTLRCRDCTKEHCLKHRFGPDHKCPGPKKPDSGFPFVGLLNRSQKRESPSNNSSWWGSSLLTAASNLRASAEAGVQKLSNATTQALQRAKDGTAQSSSGSALVEQCTQCPARFSTVSALIEHAEKSHQHSTQPVQSRVMIDVCPKCSKGFRDPALLVEHVERDHGGSSIT